MKAPPKNNKPKQTTKKREQTSSSSRKPVSTRFTIFSGDNVSTKFKRLHWNRIRIALGILIFVLFVLQTTSTVSPVWLKLNEIHSQGIWRVCTQTKNGMECIRYEAIPGYFKPIQALMVIGSAFHVISFTYFVYMLKKKTWPAFLLTINLAFTALLIILGMSIFTDKNFETVNSSNLEFGWSYFIGWIGAILTCTTAALALLDDRYKT